MDKIEDLRLTDVAADLVLLLDESSGAVDNVRYEASAVADAVMVEVALEDTEESRTFHLTVWEES